MGSFAALVGDPALFLRGFAVGFAIAAPVGPVGVLCVHRTLHRGIAAGLLSGLGAAVADAFYGAVAAFGLTSIAGALMAHQEMLRLAGGIFLCVLAVRTWMKPVRPPADESSSSEKGRAGLFFSTLAVTVANPVTILSFIAVFAGLGLSEDLETYAGAVVVVIGVFLGSAFWWLALAALGGLFHGRLAPIEMRWINRVSGAILAGFGIAILLTLLL